MKFITSSFMFLFLQLPMIFLSFVAVPLMLLSKWSGQTTWFGNVKYGRGDTHYDAPSEGRYLKQVRFLCIRNPVSNFGKNVIAVKVADWVWFEDKQVFKSLHWQYGWKHATRERADIRSFVYRPYFKPQLRS